jgi:AraC-like DNA-binding protein
LIHFGRAGPGSGIAIPERSDLFDALYQFFRGAIGFSLITAGASFLLAHGKREKALRAFGRLFIATGSLFCFSALDPWLSLQIDADALIILGLISIQSLSILEIALYIFGDERRRGAKKKLLRIGAAISLALFLVPFLDYAFGWKAYGRSVEDSAMRGPLHAFAAVAAYALPIAVTLLAIFLARWKPADLSVGGPDARPMRIGLAAVALILLDIAVSLALSLRLSYRIGHLSLELFMLIWYFYIVRHPHFFSLVRIQIGKEHRRRFALGKEEEAGIHAKLAGMAADPGFFSDEDLDLASLAERIGVPPYRLSRYFSARLATTFPAWLNGLRIAFVRKRMAERPDLSILELAIEAGYKSKTAFNTQFAKIVGMNPSEYRGRKREKMRSDS